MNQGYGREDERAAESLRVTTEEPVVVDYLAPVCASCHRPVPVREVALGGLITFECYECSPI